MQNFIIFIILSVFVSCGGSGGNKNNSTNTKLEINTSKIILDGAVEVITKYMGDFTFVYFKGSLKNIGSKKALNPRIFFYVDEDNHVLEESLCSHVFIPFSLEGNTLNADESKQFNVLAKTYDYTKYLIDTSYNSYEIIWDDYETTLEQQTIPKLTDIHATVALIQSTENPVFDALKINVYFKNKNNCDIYFEEIPVELEITIGTQNTTTFQNSYINGYSENFSGIIGGLVINLTDIQLTQYELQNNGNVLIKIKTSNNGNYSQEITEITKCTLLC